MGNATVPKAACGGGAALVGLMLDLARASAGGVRAGSLCREGRNGSDLGYVHDAGRLRAEGTRDRSGVDPGRGDHNHRDGPALVFALIRDASLHSQAGSSDPAPLTGKSDTSPATIASALRRRPRSR